MEKEIEKLKDKGVTIATLNGAFDLLHAGHLHILYEASLQADCLIVALNTDKSIKANKGVIRPIVPLFYRIQMLSAIGFVDYVTYFSEPDPIAILEIIQPNVHVNGAEYGRDCIESNTVRKYGGVVHSVELVPSLSTSNLIKIIKKCE